ncbi:lyase family protein [Streptomyces chartreusis]|uniref:lyase family protein n=1 Tax=Streptomyces chartreusis TaxID=1969 RepID=UPI003627BB7F
MNDITSRPRTDRGIHEVPTRIEYDILGEREIPADAYWGIRTQRALDNFSITGTPISQYPHLINALGIVKEAAARANAELGQLDSERADAIIAACREIRAGQLHDQFPVDVIQGGAGAATNINANEVIANRALELLGHSKGAYHHLHPNEHVNLSQSTAYVYPTAGHLATVLGLHDLLLAMSELFTAFESKANETQSLPHAGSTQFPDTGPVTRGQKFRVYSEMLEEDHARLLDASHLLREVNLGATFISADLADPKRCADTMRHHLVAISGLHLTTVGNLGEATPYDCGTLIHLSGVLKQISVRLSKTCNDLRLSSPRPLSARQEKTDLWPGNLNPVALEVVNQVAFEVIGNDIIVTMAAETGKLHSALEPLILHSLSKSITHMTAACHTLARHSVIGITNEEALRDSDAGSVRLVTALNPHIGYTAATRIAKQALETGRSVAELVLEHGLLPADELAALLRSLEQTAGER